MSKDRVHCKISKNCKGNASQFFVAGELCKRGNIAVVTMGNCPNTDVLCSNIKGTKFVHIQVKTFPLGRQSCIVGMKAEKRFGKNFFWVLVGQPNPKLLGVPDYYIIPAKNMAKNVRKNFCEWCNTLGKNNQHRNPENKVRTVHLKDFEDFKNKWSLIEQNLK
jgi:hypothetical protein